MSSFSPYDPFLEKLNLPDPSLQRLAVASLFHRLRISGDLRSDAATAAISRCLLSPSPPVADHSVRELCRLAVAGGISADDALVELQAALEACGPRLVPLFVKSIGFICRRRFRDDPQWGRRFDPVELHPFVKVLSCREEVQDELIQQALMFVAYNKSIGIVQVIMFLRPFLMYSVLRKPLSFSSSMYARDLLSSISSLSCSVPLDAINIIKLLLESLKYFACTNKEEFHHLMTSAGYVVDAFVVVVNQVTHTDERWKSDAQACSRDLLDFLLSLCAYLHKPQAGIDVVLGLAKRLLVALKEAGYHYFPGFSMTIVSIFGILSQVEFEHEHLSSLKLLIFLIEWKTENVTEGDPCFPHEELLLIFPVISLLSSPSKSIKASAAHLLRLVERLLSSIPGSQEKQMIESEFLHMSKPMSVPFKLLHQLWFQELSALTHSTYLECSGYNAIGWEEAFKGPKYWTSQLVEYLLAVDRPKVTTSPQSSENLLAGVNLLLSSVASVLVMHPTLGSSAVDLLAAIGQVDPKLGMALLQTVLFFSKMLCSNGIYSPEMLVLRLLEVLPLLGLHSVVVPLILQTVLPMLQKDTKPIVRATGIRLLCKTWIVADRTFGTLQEVLDPKAFSNFSLEREICISIAASIRDVCRHNPDRGVDLILSIAACIENQVSTVQALGFESLAHLCEADVVDFYTAWDVIKKYIRDCSTNAIVGNGLCKLLKWGALDAAVYPESSKTVLQILWNVATFRSHCPELVKTRVTAFTSLSHYEVSHIQEAIPDFKGNNLHCLLTEANTEVLKAMEDFEIKINNFEHINRPRAVKEKRAMVHKVEKLLDKLPQVLFYPGNNKPSPGELPGAALLSLVFTPNDTKGTPSHDLGKLHATYERALLEIAESLHISRNIFLALLALQSWKVFMHRWMKAAISFMDSKGSSNIADKSSKAANDIFKILHKVAAESVPRVAVHVALAIGALCTVVSSPAHGVTSAASILLMKWLFDHEHEHQQWPAAISLGLICNHFHATDRKHKVEVINELLKAVSTSKSLLIRGACGVGLGFACHDLLTRAEADDYMSGGEAIRLMECTLLQNIVKTLSLTLCLICPSTTQSLKSLYECFPCVGDDTLRENLANLRLEHCEDLEEDAWGIAGLVMGLGSSVPAIYRSGAYNAVLKVKDTLVSWIPHENPSVQSSFFGTETTEIPLSFGSCLALPSVLAFCQKSELLEEDFSGLLPRYGSLILELLRSKKSGTLHQNWLMASCTGAGSLLACITGAGVYSVKLDDVKNLLEILRETYTKSQPPLVHLGGMIGVVNAFGADAGDIIPIYDHPSPFQLNNEQKETSVIMGPILSSPVLEHLSTSMVKELLLVVKESNPQIKRYAAWSVSFLRERWLSTELKSMNESPTTSSISSPTYQNVAEDSLVVSLCSWLRDKNFVEVEESTLANTVITVLRCLSCAPRLPALDWGTIIRRCMRYGAQLTVKLQNEQAPKLLREECIKFSLAHASFSHLLLLLDELTELSRFRTLDLDLQVLLLCRLADLFKMFSSSRVVKLSSDLVAYFSSSASSYLSYDSSQRSSLRISLWKGLKQCLNGNFKESVYVLNVEKCMDHLFIILPVPEFEETGFTGSMKEWSEAIDCLSKAPYDWLMALLEVRDTNLFHGEGKLDELAKLIIARSRLVRNGSLPLQQLAKLKSYILSARSEGIWWNVLIDVVAAVSTAEVAIKRQWLLEALEISSISEHPLTAMQFVGLLSGRSCPYMPLLVLNPESVLRDLPLTLPSLLQKINWKIIAESVANKLSTAAERILLQIQDHISDIESHIFLCRIIHQTCMSLKDYLPMQKKLRLANMDVP